MEASYPRSLLFHVTTQDSSKNMAGGGKAGGDGAVVAQPPVPAPIAGDGAAPVISPEQIALIAQVVALMKAQQGGHEGKSQVEMQNKEVTERNKLIAWLIELVGNGKNIFLSKKLKDLPTKG